MITMGSEDISLVKQNNQRRYVKLQVINRDWVSVGAIEGRLISCNVNIDGESAINRTASLTIETEQTYLERPSGNMSIDLQRDMPANYYIKLWAGVQDNNTLRVRWYSQGIFIIAQSSYNFDPKTRTLSVSLIDLMSDLNGDRGGQLNSYTSIVKNEQRIDYVIKNVIKLVGIDSYSIEPITVLRESDTPVDNKAKDTDYLIPYDLNFSAGVTAYEILEKLVGLYPYYEMGFDVNGMFFVRKELLEQDASYPLIDAQTLADLVISEDTSIDWNYIKNHIEVWGKDGKYYGEADDNTPGSPFQVGSTPLRRLVVTDNQYGVDTNNICDRYIDPVLQEDLIQKQAKYENLVATLSKIKEPTREEMIELEDARLNLGTCIERQKMNIDIKGDDLAKQWAERILYDRTRLQDNVTIKTVLMPFLNDVGFKLSYRTQVDKKVRTYVVKSISHDLTGGTTTINMIRFYNDQCSQFWDKIDKPTIVSATAIGFDIIVLVNNVEFAESYSLYIAKGTSPQYIQSFTKVGTFTGTTLTYRLLNDEAGEYSVKVVAEAPYYRPSDASDTAVVTVAPLPNDILITNTGDRLVTNDGYEIKYNEG